MIVRKVSGIALVRNFQLCNECGEFRPCYRSLKDIHEFWAAAWKCKPETRRCQEVNDMALM